MTRRISQRKTGRKTPQRRRSFARPAWAWRWHQMFAVFVAFAGLGMAVASLQFGAMLYPAQASSSDNIMGYVWSDPLGWISLNDQSSGSCPGGGCGTYGVNVSPTTRQITGWAWSDQVGWVCFGSTCTNASCQNDSSPMDPLGLVNAPDGFSPKASLDAGAGVVQVRGWAKVCSLASKGWISLNCSDPGVCGGIFPYKVIYNSPSKTFYTGTHSPPLPANTTSLGWNGFTDGSGLGYFDFQYAMVSSTAQQVESSCNDGVDNDLNGTADCADVACSAAPTCSHVESSCTDGVDNDLNGLTDCADSTCSITPACPHTESQCAGLNPTASQIHACCSNGVADASPAGLVDCANPDCIAKDPVCTPSTVPESQCLSSTPTQAQIHTCCSNNVDDGVPSNGASDCADPDCQVNDAQCTPAWLQTQFGNVYAQQGITGSSFKSSTATYCLTSQGVITGFSSDKGCVQTGDQSLTLPDSASSYQGTLGSLDIQGILSGRYGKVVELGSNVNVTSAFPASGSLGGRVYHATGNVTLDAKTFQNGNGPTDRGNGLLIVEGNLNITGDQAYASTAGIQYLRDLASVGIIVKKKVLNVSGGNVTLDENTGNLTIAPSVRQMIGVLFAENTISTGTFCPGSSVCSSDVQLRILGLIAARLINLERNYRDVNTPAELIQFDGRGVANPPPGMQDVGKSLPATKDAF